MKLLFKQRLFSWFDSYDIYDENENTMYVVKGQLSWGHCLKIFDSYGNEVGMVKERIFTFLPKFEIYLDKKGEFRFRLKARNGEPILASEGYSTKAGCKNGIASVCKNVADATVVDPE